MTGRKESRSGKSPREGEEGSDNEPKRQGIIGELWLGGVLIGAGTSDGVGNASGLWWLIWVIRFCLC